MLNHYQHHSQSVQPFSESEYESESGSESEEEQEVVRGQHVLTQRSDARQLRQCGSAVGGASCGPQPALENYFAHLTQQYSCALALDGRTDPMSSYQKPKRWEEENGCTYTDGKLHYNTNRYIGYAQNNNYGHTRFAQEDRMVPISPKPTTPKKGKEEHGYAYYESNLGNNGRVGHARNNNNDLSANNYLGAGYSIPPSNSKPKLKIESRYPSDESDFDNNRHVVYGSKEYYDMMYDGSKKSSTSTSSKTSNKRTTYM